MTKIYQKRVLNKKLPATGRLGGFTLIELLVVVLIIGILAAVALPKYELAVEKSRAVEGITLARNIALANQAYYMANGTWAADINDLDLEFPGEDASSGTMSTASKKTKNFSCRATGNNEESRNCIAVCRRTGPKYTYAIVYYKDNMNQAQCIGHGNYNVEANTKMCRALTNKTSAPYTFN